MQAHIRTENVTLVVAANEAFAMPLAVTVYSALRHLPRDTDIEVFIIDGGISAKSFARIEKCLQHAHPKVRIHVKSLDLTGFASVDMGRYSSSSLARIFVAQVIPDQIARVLYLDCDIIVTDDLSVLWAIDMHDVPFMAVKENHITPDATIFLRGVLGADIPRDTPYFNSGVLLINLPEWRAKDVEQKAKAFLLSHGSLFRFPDQDALNAAAIGLWSELDPRWNLQIYDVKPHNQHWKGITHFSVQKPWRYDYRLRHAGRFFRAYLQSGWDRAGVAVVQVAAIVIGQFASRLLRRYQRGFQRLGRLLAASAPQFWRKI